MIAWEESPRQFKMSKQLDEGKFGEDLARKFLNDPIIKVNHGISHYDDVTQDKSYQDKDTDFIVWKKNGKTFGLEAKVDSHNTGNFYLETSVDYFSMVPDALNEQRVARRYRDGIDPLWHTPGWVYRSGADQILYYFRTTQLLYIFSRVDVWFYAEKLMRGGIHLDPGIRKPKMYSAENISERNGSTLFFANGLCVNAEQGKVVLDEAVKQTVHYETGWYEPEILGSGGSYRGVTKTSSEEEALQQLQKHTVNYAQRITVYKKDGKTVKREVAEYDQWEKKWMS